MNNQNRAHQPVFVLGCPRSGTSLAAGLLARCGAWCGTTRRGRIPENARGFFEHVRLINDVNKPTLRRLGCDRLGIRRLPDLDEVPSVPLERTTIFRILREDGYDGQRRWLFKDPKLSLLWPLYHRLFPEAQWIIVHRPCEEVVHSCRRAGFLKPHSDSPDFWRNLIAAYEMRLGRLMHHATNVAEVRAADIVEGNFAALRVLVQRLGWVWNAESCTQFVDPELWHGLPRSVGTPAVKSLSGRHVVG